MNKFKDYLDAAEQEMVTKHITGLRNIPTCALSRDTLAILMELNPGSGTTPLLYHILV